MVTAAKAGESARPSTVTAATRRRREVAGRSPFPALREWAAQAAATERPAPPRRPPTDGSVDSLLEAPEAVLFDLLPHWETRLSQLDGEARDDLRLVLTTRRVGASRELGARIAALLSRLGMGLAPVHTPRTGPAGGLIPRPVPPAVPRSRTRLWTLGYALASLAVAVGLSFSQGREKAPVRTSFRQPPAKTVIMELGARPLPSIGPLQLEK